VHVDKEFAERAEIVALADINEQNLTYCLGHLPSATPETYRDWRHLIERDDVDAVCISTPQYLHREMTELALAAGKHVYCEKPMALSIADCDAMIAAAQESGRVLLVGQQMRYHVHLNRISTLIAEGEIGTPQMMWLKEFRNPFPSNMTWAFDSQKSGGAIVEKSCHHFGVFNWLLDARPIRVYATGGQLVHKEIYGIESDVVDHAWITVEHEKGRESMLGLCFFAGLPHSEEGGVGTHVRDIGVIGDKGMVVTEGFHLGRNLEIRYNDRRDVMRLDLDPEQGDRDRLFERDGNWGIWVDFF
jgi:predicted dehydrogenase